MTQLASSITSLRIIVGPISFCLRELLVKADSLGRRGDRVLAKRVVFTVLAFAITQHASVVRR